MGAVLVVTKNKKQLARVSLAGSAFVIGRGNQCDYPVEEELASRKHAEISLEAGSYWLCDLQSTNGTCLNGEKIRQRTPLKDGDEISIGSTRLRFLCDSLQANAAPGGDDLTRPAPPVEPEARLGQAVIAKGKGDPLEVKVRISGGPLDGGVFKNWEGSLTIGRSLDNNVVLLDDAVSGQHASIVREGDRYFIQDFDSANGTFLDGVKVRRQELANGQKIRVGVSTLAFELVDLRKRRRTLMKTLAGMAAILVIVGVVKLLMPADLAGREIERARQFRARGELEASVGAYQAALKFEPHRAEAIKELAGVQTALGARKMLAEAEKATEQDRYDKAKELVYRVLRDFPKQQRALELEAIIKSVENSSLAMKARNWGDAVVLLEKARDKYPKSTLIGSRLEAAQSELMAEQALAKGKDALEHHQPDIAQGLFSRVLPTSQYFPEAKEHLDELERDRKATEWLQKAEAHYRQAQLTEALVEIGEGLKVSPTNAVLTNLRERARKMDGLQGPLARSEAIKQTDELEALLGGRTVCNDVLRTEIDPLNELRKRAQQTKSQIDQWLRTLSQNYSEQAETLRASGKTKEALTLFASALKADPENPAAAKAAGKLREAIHGEARKLYGEGLRFEELSEKTLARERFKKILEIAPPDEDYYKKAAAKLN
jgi:pSer/pThr/pTyr-binding forkhead associated (FHA) protein/tetratricopeptide (TPR) repeat protein